MAEENEAENPLDINPEDGNYLNYAKLILSGDMPVEEKVHGLLWCRQNTNQVLLDLSLTLRDYDFLEGAEETIKNLEDAIYATQSDLVWMDERLFELNGSQLNFRKPVNEKEAKPVEKPERITVFKNRQQFITFFDALKDSGILPPQAEQKAFAFFLSQVMGYHAEKMEQLFSEYRNDDNQKKKRDNARAVLEALEKAMESVKKALPDE